MKHTKQLLVILPAGLYLVELADAAASSYMRDESPCSPEDFARECIESVLASHRLDRVCQCA
jgi:hypothetical protein